MRALLLLLLVGCGDSPGIPGPAVEPDQRCPDGTVWACVAKLPCSEPNPCPPEHECARLDPIQGVICSPQEDDER